LHSGSIGQKDEEKKDGPRWTKRGGGIEAIKRVTEGPDTAGKMEGYAKPKKRGTGKKTGFRGSNKSPEKLTGGRKIHVV